MRVGVQEAGLQELREVRVEQSGNDFLEPLPSFLRGRVDRIHLNTPPQKPPIIYMQIILVMIYFRKKSNNISSTGKSLFRPGINGPLKNQNSINSKSKLELNWPPEKEKNGPIRFRF